MQIGQISCRKRIYAPFTTRRARPGITPLPTTGVLQLGRGNIETLFLS